MSFKPRRALGGPGSGGSLLGRALWWPLREAIRVAFGLTVVVVLVGGLLYMRLSQGPVHLPYIGEAAARLFNRDSENFRIAIGDVVFALGEPGAPAGVQFRDVSLSEAAGAPLFSVPRIMVNLRVPDLLMGDLRPTRVALIRPAARVYRDREGHFRIGVGTVLGAPSAPVGSVPGEGQQFGAIVQLLDGMAGDAPLPAELSRLREVDIVGADLSYEHEGSGRQWRTSKATFRMIRTPGGVRMRLDIGVEDAARAGAGMVVRALRPRGRPEVVLEAEIDRLRPEYLAEQLPEVEWLRLLDAPVSGRMQMTVHGDGSVGGLSGQIEAHSGRVLAVEGRGQPFDSIALDFAYDAKPDRMRVGKLALKAPALDAELSGIVELRRDPGGALANLATQFDIGAMRISLPDIFETPRNFDGGQLTGRITLAPLAIEVASAHLVQGDLVLDVRGSAREGSEGWQASLRAGGRKLSTRQLIDHWPLIAARNARAWVAHNVRAGLIDEVVSQMHFGPGGHEVTVDFRYSGLESGYLSEMSPIRNASGRGTLTLDEFFLFVDRGEVEPVPGAPVRIDGSVARLSNLQAKPSLAEITIRGDGPSSSILTLIDQAPLRLTGKLGIDPASVEGRAEVVTRLDFPLIKELKLDGIGVSATAVLHDLHMPFRLPMGHVADIAAKAVDLQATTTEMRLAGDILGDGVPLALDWSEFYGRGRNHRQIDIAGPATRELLAGLGIETEVFRGGQPTARIALSQSGAPGLDFELSADLAGAELAMPSLGWAKSAGAPGQLQAKGTFAGGVRVSRFSLTSDDLDASGTVDFAADGALRGAKLDHVRLGEAADVAAVIAPAGPEAGGGLAVSLHGKRLDLAEFDRRAGNGGGGAATRLSVEYQVDELAITPKIIVRPATGTFRQTAERTSLAEVAGKMNGRTDFTATYRRRVGEPGEIELESADAGALLDAAGLFQGAVGGALKLSAQLLPDGVTDIAGVARINDVTVYSASTFRSILDEGGVDEAARAAGKEGLRFESVRAPFEYRDGVLTLGSSIAKGPMLAVKVEGTVDEANNALNLVGVISPAYALTGIFDNVPLLGQILSGGKGEGIVAMTFEVNGTIAEPKFKVNPLSLLLPGFLRTLFSGRGSGADEHFLEQLQRQD